MATTESLVGDGRDKSGVIRRGQELLEKEKIGKSSSKGAALKEVNVEDCNVKAFCADYKGTEIDDARRLDIAERIKNARKFTTGDFGSSFEDKEGKVRYFTK